MTPVLKVSPPPPSPGLVGFELFFEQPKRSEPVTRRAAKPVRTIERVIFIESSEDGSVFQDSSRTSEYTSTGRQS